MNTPARGAALLLLLLAGCGDGGACPGLEVGDAWVKAPLPGASVGVAYASLHNAGDAPLTVYKVYADGFAQAELHRSEVVDGRARMRHVPELLLAPGATVMLEPGGLHLMLMRPQSPIAPGAQLRVTLECDAGQRTETEFAVRAAP